MTVSVVIPVRNRPQEIGRALDSVLAQSTPPAEIIVVDDFSDDDTPSVIDRYARKDPRIAMLRNEHRSGANVSRNRGAKASTGQLLAFLDSDDLWHTEKLLTQVSSFATDGELVASFTRSHGQRPGKVSVAPDYVKPIELCSANVLGTTSSAIVARHAFEAVGGFSESMRSCQDWDLWFRLAQYGNVLVIPDRLVTYTTSAGGRISNNEEAVFSGLNSMFKQIYEYLDRQGMDRRPFVARHLDHLAKQNIRPFFHPATAIQLMWRSILTKPSASSVSRAAGNMGRLLMYSAARSLPTSAGK